MSLAAVVLTGLGAAASAAEVREQRTVVVSGVRETWRLVWTDKPRPVCSPDEVEMAITCPCTGWAYGEFGDLALVRLRGGHEIDRMPLAPLFGGFDYPLGETGEGHALLPRWPTRNSDIPRSMRDDPRLVAEIRRRRPTDVMKLADYDHDGRATEFLLQVGEMPCGKRMMAAVGVSKDRPGLHALGSAAHPGQALILPLYAWQALLTTPRPKPVVTWECGDHGAEDRTEVVLSAADGVISAIERTYSCPTGTGAPRLIKRAPR